MATISSLGVGSGMDINSLVSELVAAERAPREQRITRQESRLTTEFTALAMLKGGMAGLQASAGALGAFDSMALRKTVVGDEQYFAATASGSAVAGSYDVQVEQLATAARLGSGVYPGGLDSVVGTGALNISIGGSTFQVQIDQDNDSLAQVASAINSAADNTGVRATIIREATGSFLVLSGTTTGSASSITVTASPGSDAGLQQLAVDLTAFDATRDVAAQDAIAFVSGYEIRSASNTITGAIDGVTLNLKKVTPDGETVGLGIERDDAAIQKKAEAFVASYNTLAQQMATLGRYDAATQTAGPMLGDSLLRGLESQLRRLVTDPVAGASASHRTLSSIGISFTPTGTLQLDATRFKDALAADPDAVNRVFASEDGVAGKITKFLDDRLASNGEFATRDARITTERKRIAEDKEALEARMVVIQQRYLRQFTAMDTMLAQLQSTSSYLTQQISSLSKINDR